MHIETSLAEEERDRPLVSVIIPAYQSGATLFCAIESVSYQDYPNLQLIVCDDGTEDFDLVEVEQFIRLQERQVEFKVLHQAENRGTVQNLNEGLTFAKGDWVMLLAADDMIASQETITHLMEQVSVSGRRWILSKTGMCDVNLNRCKALFPSETDIAFFNDSDRNKLYSRLCLDCFLPSSGAMYQRELLEKIGGFDSQYRLVEDWPLFLKLVRSGQIPEVSSEVCILHREGGVSGRYAGKNQDYQRDLIAVMEQEILPHLEQLDVEDQEKIRRRIQDKKHIFQYRFHCKTVWERVRWTLRNWDVIFRKIMRKRGNEL